MHAFQMLPLCVNMDAMTTAIVMRSIKLNANAVICAGIMILIKYTR